VQPLHDTVPLRIKAYLVGESLYNLRLGMARIRGSQRDVVQLG
jgi:hypothetical protein